MRPGTVLAAILTLGVARAPGPDDLGSGKGRGGNGSRADHGPCLGGVCAAAATDRGVEG